MHLWYRNLLNILAPQNEHSGYLAIWIAVWAFILALPYINQQEELGWRPFAKTLWLFFLTGFLVPLVPLGLLAILGLIAVPALLVYRSKANSLIVAETELAGQNALITELTETLTKQRTASADLTDSLSASVRTLERVANHADEAGTSLGEVTDTLHHAAKSLSEFTLPHRRSASLRYFLGLDKFESSCTVIYSHIETAGEDICRIAEESKTNFEWYDFNYSAGLPRDEEPFVRLVDYALMFSAESIPLHVVCSCRIREKMKDRTRIPDELKQNVIIVGDTTLNFACELAHEAALKKGWLLYNFEKRYQGQNEQGSRVEECIIRGVPTTPKASVRLEPGKEIPRPPANAELNTYALLTKIPNPFAPDKDMIIAGGCRRAGQVGLTLALTTPLIWDHQQDELNLHKRDSFYQALFRIRWRFQLDPQIQKEDVVLHEVDRLRFPRFSEKDGSYV